MYRTKSLNLQVTHYNHMVRNIFNYLFLLLLKKMMIIRLVSVKGSVIKDNWQNTIPKVIILYKWYRTWYQEIGKKCIFVGLNIRYTIEILPALLWSFTQSSSRKQCSFTMSSISCITNGVSFPTCLLFFSSSLTSTFFLFPEDWPWRHSYFNFDSWSLDRLGSNCPARWLLPRRPMSLFACERPRNESFITLPEYGVAHHPEGSCVGGEVGLWLPALVKYTYMIFFIAQIVVNRSKKYGEYQTSDSL